MANPIRSCPLDSLPWPKLCTVADCGEYRDGCWTLAIEWKVRGRCNIVSRSLVGLDEDPRPNPSVGSRGIGFKKSEGSDMAPPISKICGAACSRCLRRHLLQQKNTATPMMKDPATPDATDIPMIAAGVIP